MAVVTSENKADFDADKMTKNVPSSYVEEPKNLQYMKYAKMAQEASESANDEKTHGLAASHHLMAHGLAGLPENKAYHRHHRFHHEDQENKAYRKNQRELRNKTKKEIETRKAKERVSEKTGY